MKVDLKKVLTDFDGKPVEHEGKVMTLGRACSIVLSTPLEEDKASGPDRTVERWKLALALHSGTEMELTPEQAAELRARIPRVILTLSVAGQACELLKG